MKKLFLALMAAFSFIFISCFDLTQTFALNPDGTFYSTTTCAFEKDVLDLAEMSLDDIKEQIASSDEFDESEFKEFSVTDDDEKIYLFMSQDLDSSSLAAPVITKKVITINLDNGTESSESIKDLRQQMEDPGYKEVADFMFEDYSWTIKIDKSITKKIKKAKLCDEEGNGIEVPVKKEGNTFVITFPLMTIFESDYYITKLELYR